MRSIMQRVLTTPVMALRFCALRVIFGLLIAASEKTAYRGIRIVPDACEEPDRGEIDTGYVRELLDMLHEREPERFRRLDRYVANIMLASGAGGGMYTPETRTLVIDVSCLDQYAGEERELALGWCVGLILHHITLHKLTQLRAGRDPSRVHQVDRICTREVSRWFRRWYPEIHEAIDWDQVDSETREYRLELNSLSLLERIRERKRAFETSHLSTAPS